MSPLCIPKLVSLFGPFWESEVLFASPHSSFGPLRVPSPFVWSSPCPLTARLVLPVSPHSLFGPLPLTVCLVLPVSPHSLFGPPRVPSQLVWSSPCPLTACFVLPVSPHTPPRVPSQLVWSSITARLVLPVSPQFGYVLLPGSSKTSASSSPCPSHKFCVL